MSYPLTLQTFLLLRSNNIDEDIFLRNNVCAVLITMIDWLIDITTLC